MTITKTPDTAAIPETRATTTEADAQSIDGKSGQSNNSSRNEKSHAKAGKITGAGGGKKQERKH